MKYTTLGSTDVKVSKICLGTMTWGRQNDIAEAHRQLDYALDQGINFIDTAEMYAIPALPETFGKTESYIGEWLKNRSDRDELVLATKITGPMPNYTWIREGKSTFRKHIPEALEASLKRLQTDYVDLYQLHWPQRNTNYFGKRGYVHDANESWEDDIKEVLELLKKQIDAGKVRYIGLSNENPWGIMKFLQYAKEFDLPVVQSVQNPYNLLNRLYEVGSAEVSMRENCGLLAYSPLGFGVLSGKYRNGALPEGSRVQLFPNFARFSSENSHRAVDEYYKIAEEAGVSLATLALAFVNSRPFVTSNIIGATSLDQLKENIASINMEWTEELEEKVNAAHEQNPNPAP